MVSVIDVCLVVDFSREGVYGTSVVIISLSSVRLKHKGVNIVGSVSKTSKCTNGGLET